MFLATGYGKGGGLFKLGAGEPESLWKTKKLRTQLNAAVLYQGHLYGVDGDTTQKAALKCLDFATGDEKWAQPGFGSGGVIIADGKLIAFSGTGELSVAPATPTGFNPTARAQVLGGKCWTAPVLAIGYRNVIHPEKVAELLILRPDMPRSLAACMHEVVSNLTMLANEQSGETLRLAGRLRSDLQYGRIDEILATGLHAYLTQFLDRVGTIGVGISRDFLVPVQ